MKWRRDGTEAVPYDTNRGANGLLPNGNISSLATPSALRATVSLRLGHGAALTCHRHVIHYRAAAALPLKLPRCSLIRALLHMFFDRLNSSRCISQRELFYFFLI